MKTKHISSFCSNLKKRMAAVKDLISDADAYEGHESEASDIKKVLLVMCTQLENAIKSNMEKVIGD